MSPGSHTRAKGPPTSFKPLGISGKISKSKQMQTELLPSCSVECLGASSEISQGEEKNSKFRTKQGSWRRLLYFHRHRRIKMIIIIIAVFFVVLMGGWWQLRYVVRTSTKPTITANYY
ncbi:unnamed protein product [Heterosigma akashiwo]|mmetsp:Transcript_9969/g.15390  ORF Transcript_9969/g.15390 Transcript_9969/m.15390 type:complete len:118 (+) Transcript_9969:949-1302(+)